MPAVGPPRPHLALRVAVTGHRPDRLPRGCEADLHASIVAILHEITRLAGDHLDRHRGLYRIEAPHLTLATGLAEGGDRLAARAALTLPGWRLHAVLPFARQPFEEDFGSQASREEFRDLIRLSSAITELDGVPRRYDAYEGLATGLVEMGDVLIAIWDGASARGPGGTANVVRLAREAGMPVIRLDPADPARPWPEDVGRSDEGRERGMHGVTATLRALLLAPDMPEPADRFFDERVSHHRPSRLFERVVGLLEGGRSLRERLQPGASAPLPIDPASDRSALLAAGWPDLPRPLAKSGAAAFGPLLGWADELARWYAALHRRSFTVVFLMAWCAVALSVISRLPEPLLSTPVARLAEAGEVACLLVMLGTVRRSRTQGWQERWLDYRALAERLRHLWVLWPLMRSTEHVRVPREWIEGDPRHGWVAWLVRATARDGGMPIGALGGDYPHRARRSVVLVEAEEQRQFHQARHRRSGGLEDPLAGAVERLVTLAVAIAAVRVGLGFLVPEAALPLWWLAVAAIAAGLPALAAGVHAFTGLADFDGMALRSGVIVGRLTEAVRRLESHESMSLLQLGALAVRMTREMEGELGAWHATSATHRPHPG
ncbi:MAG TPA: hypothetical protein VFN22_08665 [Gemmatimonadales bacterium]|nr:hypothetical protein [Gemmatimonadales bacterium]